VHCVIVLDMNESGHFYISVYVKLLTSLLLFDSYANDVFLFV